MYVCFLKTLIQVNGNQASQSFAYLSQFLGAVKLKSLRSKRIINFLCEKSVNVIYRRMQVLTFSNYSFDPLYRSLLLKGLRSEYFRYFCKAFCKASEKRM